MLLEDATSAEQVADALRAGDEELLVDIENALEDAKYQWNRNYSAGDNEPIGFAEVVEDDGFVEKVIKSSASVGYDLGEVPLDRIGGALSSAARSRTRLSVGFGRPSKYGPFYLGEQPDYFNYKVHTGAIYVFPGHLFPEKAEYIPSAVAREFWLSLGDQYSWSHTGSVDRYDDNQADGPGETVYVNASEQDFAEWCSDVVSSYMRSVIDRSPEKAKQMFFRGLASENSALAERLAKENLPDEEILDFATQWFGGSEDDRIAVQDTVRDYFKLLDKPAGPVEVVGEWSKADIAAMGIRQGVLFENAPWKLIKLTPSQLRLEGTRMGHCVGEKGMGYIKALSDGDIEIWSLRSRDNKPRFTLEVDSSFYDEGSLTKRIEYMRTGDNPLAGLPGARAEAIKQLKGKGNRTPGYADMAKTGGIRFPDEVAFWTHAFQQIGVDPAAVDDFHALHDQQKLQANSGNVCTGFDLPYRPRVRQNRRSSKRMSSKRRGSKRRTSRRRSSRM